MIPEEIVRRERLQAIQNEGVHAYPTTAERSHKAQEVLVQFDSLIESHDPVDVAGRLRAIRKHGGITFLLLEDDSGRVQVVLHRDTIGADKYEWFHERADVGDFFQFHGPVMLTKKGEQSISAEGYTLVTKTLLPLPEKWHGLTDTEMRYRHRYLDLLANPSVVEAIRARSRMVQAMREVLEKEAFMEVETPILQPIAGGASAQPFTTHHNALHQDMYLRIAPELYLKRLLVGGFEKVYEYARCFRNEGISPQHNPEFTQIEAYWAYATIEDLLGHLERLIQAAVKAVTGTLRVEDEQGVISFEKGIPSVTFHDIILKETGIDLDIVTTEEQLLKEMDARKLDSRGVIGYGDLVDHLYKHLARPNIEGPIFVTDYPSEMKPLAKRREDNPRYSASAQLVIRGMEMFNAFNELNDPLEQLQRFEEQEALRDRGSLEAQQIDHEYIKALKHGMPPAAGYGIGIDRLAALLTGSPTIKEVILFPTLKNQQGSVGGEEASTPPSAS